MSPGPLYPLPYRYFTSNSYHGIPTKEEAEAMRDFVKKCVEERESVKAVMAW